VLICTDVASRGLDFKGVTWIIQWDLSSNIKEYVNRVGRTARIAAEGSALSFVMPDEAEYVKFLKKKYQITLNEKNRLHVLKSFETKFQEKNSNLKYKFRKLVNIEANEAGHVDEQQESLHAIRQKLTSIMLDEKTGLKEMGQTARSSSTRAYAGHSAEMRHIFDMKKLNLTEYARSFGLYKQLYFAM
jgi:ATP-dependent RNA helicase DDX31/DBP7